MRSLNKFILYMWDVCTYIFNFFYFFYEEKQWKEKFNNDNNNNNNIPFANQGKWPFFHQYQFFLGILKDLSIQKNEKKNWNSWFPFCFSACTTLNYVFQASGKLWVQTISHGDVDNAVCVLIIMCI